MSRASVLAPALALALALAGCTTTDPETGEPVPISSPDTTAVQAQLAGAIAQIPDAISVDADIYRGSQLLLTLNGTFDNASGESYLALKADPETLQALSGGQVSGDLLGSDVSLYSTRTGDLFLRGATGFLFAGEARTSALDPGNSLRSAPMGAILEGGGYVRDLLAGAKLRSVEPVTYRGVEALQIVADVPHETRNATVAVILDPQANRILHVETTLAADPDAPGDPLGGATLRSDLLYAPRAPPERVLRAMSLLHSTTASIFGGDPHLVVWTFQGAPRVPLAEAVALGRPSNLDLLSGDPQGSALWSFSFADVEKDFDGVHVVFTDADGDGKVGAGDTLRASAEGDVSVPNLLLSDSATGVALLSVSG